MRTDPCAKRLAGSKAKNAARRQARRRFWCFIIFSRLGCDPFRTAGPKVRQQSRPGTRHGKPAPLRYDRERLIETEYKVRLEIFEGPLDLLLYLIKRDELDIYDISLERITQQYLEYLQAFKELNIDVAGEFVVMAANLIYLKSRSLLPADQQPPEEDVDEDDPRWDLIRQLIEYKKFKEAAAHLQSRELQQERIFARIGDGLTPDVAPFRLGKV